MTYSITEIIKKKIKNWAFFYCELDNAIEDQNPQKRHKPKCFVCATDKFRTLFTHAKRRGVLKIL